MAIPNLKTVATVNGKSASYQGTGALADALLNPVASGQSWRVNFIQACNNDNAAAQIYAVALRKASGVVRYLAINAPLAIGGAEVVLDRPLTLEEGDSIQAASTSTTLKVDFVINYDILAP